MAQAGKGGTYGGFYSKQEQEDVLTTQITNPNRVGSGFINLGPQQRFAPAQSTNWQASGGPPPPPTGLADIWNAPAGPPKAPPPPQARPPAQAFGSQASHGSSGFGGQAAPPQGVNELFNQFGIDPNQQARAAAQAQAFVPQNPVPPPMTMPPAPASVAQQPFLNGGAGHGVAAPQPGSSLMSMLGGAAQPPPPNLNPGFANLNGVSAQGPNPAQVFKNIPNVSSGPPMGRPSPGQGHLPHQAPGHGGGFINNAAPPNSYRGAPPPAAPPAPPKTLASAADYQAAAASYKPPPGRGNASGVAQSISRKAESHESAAATPRGTPRAQEPRIEEWECRRCTFLNNGSLWECEMCGFERPGKSEQQAAAVAAQRSARSEDSGWQTASKERKPAAAQQAQPTAGSGKSKAQKKNEKRRAK